MKMSKVDLRTVAIIILAVAVLALSMVDIHNETSEQANSTTSSQESTP